MLFVLKAELVLGASELDYTIECSGKFTPLSPIPSFKGGNLLIWFNGMIDVNRKGAKILCCDSLSCCASVESKLVPK